MFPTFIYIPDQVAQTPARVPSSEDSRFVANAVVAHREAHALRCKHSSRPHDIRRICLPGMLG